MAVISRGFCLSSLFHNRRYAVVNRLSRHNILYYCSTAQPLSEEDEAAQAKKLKKICDISGLSYELKCRLKHNNRLPQSFYRKPHRNIRIERDEKRKHYAMLGKASGIDPGILWDTKEEYREKLAEELSSLSLEETLRLHFNEQSLTEKAKAEKIENVKVRMEYLMPEVFEQIYKKQQKAQEVSQASSLRMEKMNKLLEEARDYLGYEITRKDPEFNALMDKLREEEREAKKRERREQNRKYKLGHAGKPSEVKPSDEEKVAAQT